MTRRQLSIVHSCLLGSICLVSVPSGADAGTRLLFKGEGDVVITGRTMDSCQEVGSNVWIFPRGIERDGGCGPESLKWTSQFGSIVLSVNDEMTVDGMNERGLVVNGIALPDVSFGQPDGVRSLVCSSIWAQWILDSFGSVRDAVSALESANFFLVPPSSSTEGPFFAHLAMSDPSGESALLGWNDGKLGIYFGSDFRVLSGTAPFDSQILVTRLRKEFGDAPFLEDPEEAPIEFVTAFITLDRLPKVRQTSFGLANSGEDFSRQANASVLGALRSISTPFGLCHAVRPDFTPTRWRVMYDQKNMVMHVDCAITMNCFTIRLGDLNFSDGSAVRRLSPHGAIGRGTMTSSDGMRIGQFEAQSGDVTGHFENSAPFAFLTAGPR